MFTFFTDTDENEKTLSQRRGRDRARKETERKRNSDEMRREQKLRNNTAHSHGFKAILNHFWPSSVLKCTDVDQRNQNFYVFNFTPRA